jgi:hypothetical protein
VVLKPREFNCGLTKTHLFMDNDHPDMISEDEEDEMAEIFVEE